MRKTSSTIYATYGEHPALYKYKEEIPAGKEFEKFRNREKAVLSIRNHCGTIYYDYTGGNYTSGTLDYNIGIKTPYQAISYVKGAYNNLTKRYGCGIVFHSRYGIEEYTFADCDIYGMRHIAGELKAAQIAVLRALCLELTNVTIVHDYTGVEKLATCEWSANQPGTQRYQNWMRIEDTPLDIQFIKVKCHSGIIEYDRAETLAKIACDMPGIINYGILG